MKKLLLILLCLPMIGFGQLTMIPDASFEQELINLGYDNGAINGSVYTAMINTVTNLDISSSNISDLTGIEAFTDLTSLVCDHNQLTSLDVSTNLDLTFLNCSTNVLTSLDLSNNTALTYLDCSINTLTSLDVSQNTALTTLWCFDNQLTSLDVSQNTDLIDLYCWLNQLTILDVRNGNNTNFTFFDITNNPNLSCINVDDFQYSLFNWTNIDPQHYFSNNCSGGMQQTYVPDNNFEAYLETNGMGNGVPNDDSVTTANINGVISLDIAYQSISDLTGIEGFSNLSWMDCSGNLLITLDLSQNDSINYFNFSNNIFLECINLQNGNNCNIGDLDTNGNPSLICIAIDTYPYNGCPQFNSPPIALLMNTCSNVSCGLPSSIKEHTTNKELLKVTDLLGKETKETNQPLFYLYDDGTVEKRIVIE